MANNNNLRISVPIVADACSTGNMEKPERRRMVGGTLLGQHTHPSSNGVAVHIWRRG